MLFKSHGLSLLTDVPQLYHPLIVTADQVTLDVAVPAHTAQFGPAQSHTKWSQSMYHVGNMVHAQPPASLVFSIVKRFSKQLLKANNYSPPTAATYCAEMPTRCSAALLQKHKFVPAICRLQG